MSDTGPDRSNWPEGVTPIMVSQMQRIGVGRDRQLYWDGQPIEIQRRLKLSRWQIAGAFIVGLGAVIGGVGTGVNEGFDFGCKVHWLTTACPR